MSKKRFDQICAGLLALMLCGPGVSPTMAAGEPAPGTTIAVEGSGNNEALNYPVGKNLTVALGKDAALTVEGGANAVALGAGGHVALGEGAGISFNSDGDVAAEVVSVAAVSVQGTDPDRDNRVDLGKGSSVAVKSAKVKDTTAISLRLTDEAHVAMYAASVAAEGAIGNVCGISMDNVTSPHTAQVSMTNGSTVTVKGGTEASTGPGETVYGESVGIGMDNLAHGVVSLDGASVVDVSEASDEDSALLDSYGVKVRDGEKTEVSLNGASEIRTAAEVSGLYGDADAYGVVTHDVKNIGVTLGEQAAIDSMAKASGRGGSAEASGICLEVIDKAHVFMDEQSRVHSSAAGDQFGAGFASGVYLEGYGGSMDAGSLAFGMDNGSVVASEASGAMAGAGGVVLLSESRETYKGEATISGGSEISATAMAKGLAELGKTSSEGTTELSMATATALGMAGTSDVKMQVANAKLFSTMTAAAEGTGTGDAGAVVCASDKGLLPVGVGAMGYTTAEIGLAQASVTVNAKATASAEEGLSRAVVGMPPFPSPMGETPVAGILAAELGRVEENLVSGEGAASELEEPHTALSITDGSVINVKGEAQAEELCVAQVAGIAMVGMTGTSTPDTLKVADSEVHATAITKGAESKGSLPPSEPESQAIAVGISAQVMNGAVTMDIDHSVISAGASGEKGMAAGIAGAVQGGNLEINLTNGSRVSARADVSQAMADGAPVSVGLALSDGSTVNIDSSSSVEGEWAVWTGTVWPSGEVYELVSGSALKVSEPPVVNNSGLLSGRIEGCTLNTTATATLKAILDAQGTYLYSAEAAANEFYFKPVNATLAAGTTFQVDLNGNLGVKKPGDVKTYAMLKAEGTIQDWNVEKLALEVEGNSPLLGLSWVDVESENELVAQITFLSPAEAGLSGNATAAFAAALADMPIEFVFGTDPEAWSPNVSGAFLTGMTQTLGASQANIGNRLGGLMGLNTGDEIVAANGLWYNIAFTEADQGERDGVVGFDADTDGISIGYDRQSGPVILGVACTIGKTDADADDNSSSMDMTDNLFSLYGSYDAGGWFGEAVLSAGIGDVDSTRRLDAETFTADYDSTSYNALAKVGMTLNRAGWQINPLLAVDYSYKKYDGYTEEGGTGALDVESQDYTVLNVGGGATLQRSWVKAWGILTPELSGMLRYDLEGDRIVTTAKFVGGSTAFVAHGADPAETSWELSAALTLASLEDNAVSLRLGYDYAGREDFNAHSVSGKIRYEF